MKETKYFFINPKDPNSGFAHLTDIKESKTLVLSWTVNDSKIRITLAEKDGDIQLTPVFLFKIIELGTKLTSKHQTLYQEIQKYLSSNSEEMDAFIKKQLRNIAIELQKQYLDTIPQIHDSKKKRDYVIKDVDSVIQLLSSPNILDQIISIVSQQLAGETKNIVFVTVSLIQCFTPKYIQIVLFARSGTGKSHLAKAVLNLFPEQMIYTGFELSPTALRTATLDGLFDNIRIFYLTQRDGASRKARYHFKMLSSRDNDGKLKAIITDRETGKPIEMQLKPMGLISTHIDTGVIDSEEETRNVQVHLDESSEQTKKVLEYQGKEVSTPRSFKESFNLDNGSELVTARDAIYVIEMISNNITDYIIPYGEYLSTLIDDQKVKARAFFPMLQGWIYGNALLNFMNRDFVETPDGKLFLVANENDLRNAIKYAEENLSRAYYRMSEHRQIILEIIKELQTSHGVSLPESLPKVNEDWTSGALKLFKGIHTRDIIDTLLNSGLIERSESWFYEELKEMVEDGLLSVYSVVTNSELNRTEGFRPGKYYRANAASDKFIKDVDWNKLVQEIDNWYLTNVELTEATMLKLDPIRFREKLKELPEKDFDTSWIRGTVEALKID